MHAAENVGILTQDEVSIVQAVLDLREKTCSQIMTKLEHCVMLEFSTEMGRKTIEYVGNCVNPW